MNPSEVKDFYERLGVSKTASEQELKQAYRALAQQWHPDHNPGRESESRIEFIAVSEAYQSISQMEKPSSEQPAKKRDYEFYNSFYQDFLRAVEKVSPDLVAALRLFGGANLPLGMEGMFESILRKE